MTNEQAQGDNTREGLAKASGSYDMSKDPAIQSLTDDQLKYLSSTLRELIAKRIEGIHYAEGRRSQLMVIGGALAAVGVAVLPLGMSSNVTEIKWACITFSILSIIVGLFTWFAFIRQTNYPYPFVKPAQTWKWFYHHALPDKAKFGQTLCSVLGHRVPAEEQSEYRSQWEIFRTQVTGLSDAQVDATQDLKQLYLLHVDERYKNHFLSQLRDILKWGVFVVILLPFIVFICAVPFEDTNESGKVSHSEVAIESSWLPTGAVRNHGISERDLQFRLSLKFTNRGNAPYVATTLMAEDSDGNPIFAEFVLPHGGIRVDAGESVTLIGHFWIAANDRPDLARIVGQ